jgi:phosphoenolpyruvate---glycerone phosphotransferase subunit DhaM
VPVGLVLVSHSARIAEGLAELARQMAPTVPLVPAGGTDDGGIGTSFDRVTAAIDAADTGQGVVLLCDLGSAVLTAETAVEVLDAERQDRVRIADAPLVEGGVAAAVAAEGGADLDGVVAAASGQGAAPGRSSGDGGGGAGDGAVQGGDPGGDDGSGPERASASITLINPEGLHARPAAALVRAASGLSARVTVNGADAASLLQVLALGLRQGAVAEVTATGSGAQAAVDRIVALAQDGFGER